VTSHVLASVGCAVTWAAASLLFARALRDVENSSPTALNLLKCLLAFPPLVLLGLWQGEGWPTAAGHGVALFVSATLGLGVSDTAYFVALARLGVARGVLFIPLIPVVTAVFAAVFLGEPFGARQFAGMTMVLGGIVLVLMRRDEKAGSTSSRDLGVGVVAGVGSAIAQGISNVLMKTAVVDGSATHVAALRIGFGAVSLAVVVAFVGGPRRVVPFLRRGVLGPIVLASCIGTFVGMWLGTFGAKGLPIGVATTLAATTPVWALLFARAAGEQVTFRSVVGAVVALVGVVVLASSVGG
jgi:drug/metabolite transporter (DMT)-like permease